MKAALDANNWNRENSFRVKRINGKTPPGTDAMITKYERESNSTFLDLTIDIHWGHDQVAKGRIGLPLQVESCTRADENEAKQQANKQCTHLGRTERTVRRQQKEKTIPCMTILCEQCLVVLH